jgi:hypothetical protein
MYKIMGCSQEAWTCSSWLWHQSRHCVLVCHVSCEGSDGCTVLLGAGGMEPSGTRQQHGPGVQGAAVLRCCAAAVIQHILDSSAARVEGHECTKVSQQLPAAATAAAAAAAAVAAPLMSTQRLHALQQLEHDRARLSKGSTLHSG